MEIVERLFGIKRRKQERLLTGLGVSGERRRELVGPEYEDALVVKIDNDQFLKMLQTSKTEEVLRHLVHQSDTHQSLELYIDIGEGVKIKTGVVSIDYSNERTLLSDLYEMSYRYKSIQSKNHGSFYGWGVYRLEKEE